MDSSQPSSRRAEVIATAFSEYRSCNRWAIIVGISEYKHSDWNLRFADRDAETFAQLLQTDSGGGFNPEYICQLINQDATTQNLTKALRSFLQQPAREDLVVVYLACHGSPDINRPENVYLLTHDTDPVDIAGTALPMREINLALTENLLAEKVIVLADTCHSAAIGNSSGRRSTQDQATVVNRYLQEVSKAKNGMALITSAEANEASFEDVKWGGGHGVFTYYLLEGMRGAADRNKNGIISVGELFEYVRENVKQATAHQQHPVIGTSAFDRNLPISVNPNVEPPDIETIAALTTALGSNTVSPPSQPVSQTLSPSNRESLWAHAKDKKTIGIVLCSTAVVAGITIALIGPTDEVYYDYDETDEVYYDYKEYENPFFENNQEISEMTQTEANSFCDEQYERLKSEDALGDINPKAVIKVWGHVENGDCVANYPHIRQEIFD